jgi:hypothetical protein
MHRRGYLFIFYCILLFLLTIDIFAQELIKRHLQIQVHDATEAEGNIIKAAEEYIKIYLSERGDIIVTEVGEESDCRIEIDITPENSGYRITLQGTDSIFPDNTFTRETEQQDINFSLLNSELLPALGDLVSAKFQPRKQEIVEEVTEKIVEDIEVKRILKGVVLALEGEPGTVIRTETGEKYALDSKGLLELELPFNVTFVFRAEHPRYYPVSHTVTTKTENIYLELDQNMASRWSVETGIRFYDWSLELGLSYFFIPNTGFLFLGITQNLLTLGRALFGVDYSQVHASPALGLGFYILPADNNFRFALTAGLFTRVVFPEELPVYLSKVETFGVQLGLRGDFSPWEKTRFYVEYKPRLLYSSAGTDISAFGSFQMGNIHRFSDKLYLYYILPVTLGTRFLF